MRRIEQGGDRHLDYAALTEEVRFAQDSPLEEDGFELSVPGERVCGFEAVGTIGFV
jgi:hypothetical protein